MENNNDYGYLAIGQSDKQVLKHISEMGEQLKQLKEKQFAAEAAAEAARKAFEHYANVVIPSEMHACGLESVSLSTGGRLSLKRNYYCQPNKNDADRARIVKWLRENGGGHLVEHNATVSADDMDRLDGLGVPYVENTSVNTNRLKSFIKDGLGVTTGVQKFGINDIPDCVHFQEVTTVELDLDGEQ